MTGRTKPYRQKDVIYAVNCSAVAGWAIVEVVVSSKIGFSTLPWNSLIGLPVAILSAWIFGAPFVIRAMRKHITYPRAALLGLTISSICAFMYIFIGRMADLAMGVTRHATQFGEEIDAYLVVDGYLTMAGVREFSMDVLIYLMIGLIIGLIVRIIVGPGREFTEADTEVVGSGRAQNVERRST